MNCSISTRMPLPTARNAVPMAEVVLPFPGPVFTNLLLAAPVWLQMIHLLLADTVWISLVLLGAQMLSPKAIPSPRR